MATFPTDTLAMKEAAIRSQYHDVQKGDVCGWTAACKEHEDCRVFFGLMGNRLGCQHDDPSPEEHPEEHADTWPDAAVEPYRSSGQGICRTFHNTKDRGDGEELLTNFPARIVA